MEEDVGELVNEAGLEVEEVEEGGVVYGDEDIYRRYNIMFIGIKYAV